MPLFFVHSIPSVAYILPGLRREDITPDLTRFSATDIIKAVTTYYSISEYDIQKRGRQKQNVYARQIAMFLLRMYTPLTLMQVAKIFKKRDHSTVIFSCEKVADMLKARHANDYRHDVPKILSMLKQTTVNDYSRTNKPGN